MDTHRHKPPPAGKLLYFHTCTCIFAPPCDTPHLHTHTTHTSFPGTAPPVRHRSTHLCTHSPTRSTHVRQHVPHAHVHSCTQTPLHPHTNPCLLSCIPTYVHMHLYVPAHGHVHPYTRVSLYPHIGGTLHTGSWKYPLISTPMHMLSCTRTWTQPYLNTCIHSHPQVCVHPVIHVSTRTNM